MALVAQLYGMDPYEASQLTQPEVDQLLDEAQLAFVQMSASPDLQQVLQPRLGRTLRAFRAARQAGQGGGQGAAGEPDQ